MVGLRHFSSQRGVTLVKPMIVMALLAASTALATLAATPYQHLLKQARLAADLTTASSLRSAVAIYYGVHNGDFPPDKAALTALVSPPPTWQCAGQDFTYRATDGTLTLRVKDPDSC